MVKSGYTRCRKGTAEEDVRPKTHWAAQMQTMMSTVAFMVICIIHE